MSYTKGKWRKGLNNERAVICDTPDGLKLTICTTSIGEQLGLQSAIDNATLISAAPDMLEALIALMEYCKHHDIKLGSGIVHQIETSINKATATFK